MNFNSLPWVPQKEEQKPFWQYVAKDAVILVIGIAFAYVAIQLLG